MATLEKPRLYKTERTLKRTLRVAYPFPVKQSGQASCVRCA